MNKKLLITIPLVLVVLAAGTYLFANHQVKSLVDQRIASFIDSGQYQRLDYESVGMDMQGDISMKSLHVIDEAGYEYILDDIHVSDFDYFNATPQHLLLTARGIRFPAGIPPISKAPSATINRYLDGMMESDYLPLEIRYQYDYQPEGTPRLDNQLSISLPDAFHLSTASTLSNVMLENMDNYADTLSVTPAPYSALLQTADIPAATLALEDLGFVEGMLAIQGQDFGMDADEYRQTLLAQLQTMLLFAPRQLQGFAQDYLGRFAEFLEGNKTLQVSIAPEFGGNMQQLQGEIQGALFIGNFSRIVEVLNLEVETLP